MQGNGIGRKLPDELNNGNREIEEAGTQIFTDKFLEGSSDKVNFLIAK
jgi:hypothetical protein